MAITNRFGYGVSMEFIRHLIDSGRLFTFAQRTINSTTAFSYRLKTGANKVNIAISLSSGAKATIDLIEAPTITTAGTVAVLYNNNRNFKDDTMLAKAFTGAAYTGGTIFKPNQAGFGTAPWQSASGDAAPGSGYVLLPNTEYVFLITPAATGCDTMFIAELFESDK